MQQLEEKDIPEPELIFTNFLERHSLVPTQVLEDLLLPIYWSSIANILIHDGYSVFSEEFFKLEPTVGVLLNMLSRSFEHIEAAIIAFATASPASCEVIARTAMEASVNVIYILSGDKVVRLHSYFSHYLEEVDKQIDKWLKASVKMQSNELKVHQEKANYRRKANNEMKVFVKRIVSEMRTLTGSTRTERWPNIAEKFQAVGLESTYRTAYARMCSQTHNDAEDTLQYMIFKLFEDDDRLNIEVKKAALETINFSHLMLYFAVSSFLLASTKYAEIFGLTLSANLLRYGKNLIEQEMQEIGKYVGAP